MSIIFNLSRKIETDLNFNAFDKLKEKLEIYFLINSHYYSRYFIFSSKTLEVLKATQKKLRNFEADCKSFKESLNKVRDENTILNLNIIVCF